MEGPGEPVLLQALRGHRGEVSCVDAAGALLVSGGGEGALRTWRWARGAGWSEAARAERAHRYGVTAARLAPGAQLLASAGVDGAVRVWAARALAPRRTLAAPGAAAVRALCWAGRARLLAGHDDGALRVWAARGVLLACLRAHEGALHAVAAPARAALLLTACTDGVLKVFDLAEVCRREAAGEPAPAPLTWVDGAHDMGVLCADAAESGEAATGGQDALVRVWAPGARGLAPGASLAGHGAGVAALRWAAGGALLLSASLDRTARVWAPRAAACLRVLHAHKRYLTCVALAPDLSYILTGSNDKSVRMWSMGALSLDDELEPPCAVLQHFGVGDLEGIGEVEEPAEDATAVGDIAEGGARRVWHDEHAGAGPINCISTHGPLVATACSDGLVRVYRWAEDSASLEQLHALEAHQYPAMAVELCAGGTLLLSAGLDGRACLWDVQSGVQLRVLSAGGGAAGEAGGGGVRGARVSPRGPARLLLATDDGLAPLWTLANDDPKPDHVFAGHTEAVLCCAWSHDACLLATGAASGELRVMAAFALLHHEAQAHDLGVQSCDFAPPAAVLELPADAYLLATAGSDSYVKLWIVETQQEEGEVCGAAVRLVRQVEAHGGGAACVRWGAAPSGLLASAGADRWARVWRAGPGGALRELAAAPAPAGALAAALLAPAAPAPSLLLAAGLAGELAAWQLPLTDLEPRDDDEAAPPCLWGPAGVARWLRENITRAPGVTATDEEEAALIQKSVDTAITGSRLVNDPIDELLQDFGYGPDETAENGTVSTSARLREELAWLRRPPPPFELERAAPHALLCPLSHRLLAEPARAADGYSYERAHILDWFLANEAAVSPVSSLRLHNARVLPNYVLRDQLRQFLREHDPQP